MSSTFQAHLEILPEAQRRLWPELRPTLQLGLVLYGGTAIALRLGHRSSVDFDFFTDQPLDRIAIHTAFPFLDRSLVLQDQPDTFTVVAPCGDSRDHPVKISFFGALGFGRVGEPEWTHDRVLQVASPDDLMATKLKVLLQRIEAKDYQDIAALIKAGVSLGRGLAAARTMYGHNFQPSESLKALVYFAGGDLDSVARPERETLIKAVNAVRKLPTVKILARNLSPPMGHFPGKNLAGE
jgi:hypothetical protein